MATFAGRYTLMQKLASGGMAEVFLARMHGIEGFEKLVVLKRILPHQADNPEFVRMFLDEARVAADLSHPNVVSVFDAGLADGQYFLSMEYLRGRDVAAVFHEARARGAPVPLPVALHCLIDAARGLHAAHTKRDLEGRALHIVHRDVSPQNLFVTWDGVTKVLDFGIAHAASRGAKTESGVVKGKIAYLSPEQLEGVPLDARSDQFALGIVAWELLTGQRLFHRPSDAETLRAILEHRVPAPSSVEPAVPAPVEAVVLRMLAEAREARYPDCAAAADALEAYLDDARLPHSAAKVAATLRALFPEAEASAAGPAQPPTRPSIPLPPRAELTTRPARKRPPLPREEDFLAAVSEFLSERPEHRRSNLVPPGGPFVGREAELAALERHLEGGARLVTVVGFGGLGKTRLVSELAWRQREARLKQGGAWLVELEDARTPDDVCKAVARALEVELPLQGNADSVTQAGRTLRSLGRALVVLDNFEQVLAAAPGTVGRWLEAAPDVTFVVTSREPLRLDGEVVFRLDPLPLSGGPASVAVQLFVARAQAAGVALAEGDLPVIAELCTRLEGHALAIELAAAQLPGATPQELLERLSSRLLALGDPAGGRHGTLWNTIDWSWQLLSPVEQSALAQLSVFRGGFTPESAVEVLDLTSFQLAPPRLEVLTALHRKSLLSYFVAPERPGALRLRMFESVHQFAAEKLEAARGVVAARARHASHFLALGEACVAQLGTSQTEEAMAQLFVEHDNLAEVFERALSTLPPTSESATRALRALHVLEPVMVRKGPYAAHLALLDEALRVGRTVGVDAASLAMGLRQRGNAWRVRGRLAQAVEDLEQALVVARTTTDKALTARITCDLAVARFVSGQLDPALEGLEAAHALAREADDGAALVETLAYLAIARVARHEPALGIVHCDEALPIARARGDRLNEARLLGTLGTIFQDQRRPELAAAFLRDAVTRCRAIREVRLLGYFLGKLAHVQLERGEYASARRHLEEALGLLADVGDLRHEGLFMAYVGTLEAAEGRVDAARVTMGSAKLRLDSVKDPMLLTALALRTMDVEVRAAAASRSEARALLDDVHAPRGNRRARVDQSEEVRLAARVLERTLATP
jgi:predicted ATPase/serine/threonine protein kinase